MHCENLATLLLDNTTRWFEPILKESWFGRKIILTNVTRGPIVERKRWKGDVQLEDWRGRLSNSTGESISVA